MADYQTTELSPLAARRMNAEQICGYYFTIALRSLVTRFSRKLARIWQGNFVFGIEAYTMGLPEQTKDEHHDLWLRPAKQKGAIRGRVGSSDPGRVESLGFETMEFCFGLFGSFVTVSEPRLRGGTAERQLLAGYRRGGPRSELAFRKSLPLLGLFSHERLRWLRVKIMIEFPTLGVPLLVHDHYHTIVRSEVQCLLSSLVQGCCIIGLVTVAVYLMNKVYTLPQSTSPMS